MHVHFSDGQGADKLVRVRGSSFYLPCLLAVIDKAMKLGEVTKSVSHYAKM